MRKSLIANQPEVVVKTKSLLIPTIYFLVIIAVSVYAYRIGIERINKQRSEIEKEKITENILIEKDLELKQMKDLVNSIANNSVEAMPERNPALQVMTHLNQISGSTDVRLEEFRIGGLGEEDDQVALRNVPVSFLVDISKGAVLNYYGKIDRTLPIMVLSELDISLSGSEDAAEIETKASSYWSPFPKELPKVTEPINKLTDTDISVLQSLSSRNLPEFTKLEPDVFAGRENPFIY